MLKGGASFTPRDLYFVRREGGAAYGGKSYEAIIRGDWKLLQNDPWSPLELHNLKTDPQAKDNLPRPLRRSSTSFPPPSVPTSSAAARRLG